MSLLINATVSESSNGCWRHVPVWEPRHFETFVESAVYYLSNLLNYIAKLCQLTKHEYRPKRCGDENICKVVRCLKLNMRLHRRYVVALHVRRQYVVFKPPHDLDMKDVIWITLTVSRGRGVISITVSHDILYQIISMYFFLLNRTPLSVTLLICQAAVNVTVSL